MSERSIVSPGPQLPESEPLREELSLGALLEDEVTRLVMVRDGVSPADIKALAQIVPLVSRHGEAAHIG